MRQTTQAKILRGDSSARDGDDNGELWKKGVHKCDWWVKEKARAILMCWKLPWSMLRQIAWFVDRGFDQRAQR